MSVLLAYYKVIILCNYGAFKTLGQQHFKQPREGAYESINCKDKDV